MVSWKGNTVRMQKKEKLFASNIEDILLKLKGAIKSYLFIFIYNNQFFRIIFSFKSQIFSFPFLKVPRRLVDFLTLLTFYDIF